MAIDTPVATHCMAEDANANAIADNAAKPKSVSVDGQSVTQHSIDDQIKADEYRIRRNAQANRSRLGGIGIARLKGGSSA